VIQNLSAAAAMKFLAAPDVASFISTIDQQDCASSGLRAFDT
jgi:hypothetical protein